MRSEQEIRDLLSKAQASTSARAASVSLIVPQDESTWVVLLQSGEDELAIEIKDTPDITDEELQQQMTESLKKLF